MFQTFFFLAGVAGCVGAGCEAEAAGAVCEKYSLKIMSLSALGTAAIRCTLCSFKYSSL